MFVARLHGDPVGIGCLTLHDDVTAEVKRLWIDPAARGLGVARRILTALEARAVDHGARVAQLDTNSSLIEAIALYRAAGYVEIPRYNDFGPLRSSTGSPSLSAASNLIGSIDATCLLN